MRESSNNNEEYDDDDDDYYECVEIAKNQTLQSINSLKAPLVYDISLINIEKYLSTYVMYQTNAMYDVAKLIKTTIERVFDYQFKIHNKPCVLLLTGPTGLGKNLCVTTLKYLFRMHIDNKLAYIEYRFGVMDHNAQFSVLTGTPSSIRLIDENESLYDKLMEASLFYEGKEQEERDGILQPHIILILFDEIDKANKSVLNAINSLLSDGCFPNARGQMYRLPKTTRLIICFTSNFGSDTIEKYKHLNLTNYYENIKIDIKKEMIRKGYPGCDISRLGTIIPFFPPTREELRIILINKFFDILMRRDKFIDKYGVVKYTDKSLVNFIDSFIISNHHENSFALSIKDMTILLDVELSCLFSMTNELFYESIDKKSIKLPLDEPPTMIFDTISHEDIDKNEYFRRVEKNIEFSRRLNKVINSKSNVHFLTVTHPLVEQTSIYIVTSQSSSLMDQMNEEEEEETSNNFDDIHQENGEHLDYSSFDDINKVNNDEDEDKELQTINMRKRKDNQSTTQLERKCSTCHTSQKIKDFEVYKYRKQKNSKSIRTVSTTRQCKKCRKKYFDTYKNPKKKKTTSENMIL
jgi:hypothetical protein